jgi:hypothetical protein
MQFITYICYSHKKFNFFRILSEEDWNEDWNYIENSKNPGTSDSENIYCEYKENDNDVLLDSNESYGSISATNHHLNFDFYGEKRPKKGLVNLTLCPQTDNNDWLPPDHLGHQKLFPFSGISATKETSNPDFDTLVYTEVSSYI